MKALSEDDLRMNQQAANVATSVLSETVQAATRCEQVTQDMAAQAAGVGSISRGLMRGMKAMTGPTSVGKMAKGMETGGLPKSFLLAVTAKQVHAIEDKHDGAKLVGGKLLKSWDREGFRASRGPSVINAASGVPDDRQVLVLYLPIEGGKNRYLQAAARNTAATPGMPQKFMVAKDDSSEKVLDALVSKAAPGANIMIGGTSLQDMMAQAGGQAAAADPTERLSKLADLRDRGVLTDEEFAAQKAKILSES